MRKLIQKQCDLIESPLKAIITISMVAVISGCATSPEDLTTAYVSPLKYQDYNCDQIVSEMGHVSNKTVSLYQSLDKKASDDSTQMTVGLIIFWPTLFFLEGGDGPEAQQYSALKGEFEALEISAKEQNCDKNTVPQSPEQIVKEEEERKEKEKKEKGGSGKSGPWTTGML